MADSQIEPQWNISLSSILSMNTANTYIQWNLGHIKKQNIKNCTLIALVAVIELERFQPSQLKAIFW